MIWRSSSTNCRLVCYPLAWGCSSLSLSCKLEAVTQQNAVQADGDDAVLKYKMLNALSNNLQSCSKVSTDHTTYIIKKSQTHTLPVSTKQKSLTLLSENCTFTYKTACISINNALHISESTPLWSQFDLGKITTFNCLRNR